MSFKRSACKSYRDYCYIKFNCEARCFRGSDQLSVSRQNWRRSRMNCRKKYRSKYFSYIGGHRQTVFGRFPSRKFFKVRDKPRRHLVVWQCLIPTIGLLQKFRNSVENSSTILSCIVLQHIITEYFRTGYERYNQLSTDFKPYLSTEFCWKNRGAIGYTPSWSVWSNAQIWPQRQY